MDTGIAISSFINVCCTGGLFYFFRRLNRENASLSEIQSTPVFTPSSALKIAQQGNLQQNPLNSSEYIIKAFVEGFVECSHPIKSRINGKTDLVYSKTFKTEIRSNDSLIELAQGRQPFRKDLSIKAPLYFALKDAITSDRVSVRKNLEVETLDALDPIAEETKMKELNLFEKVLVQIGRVIAIFGIFKRDWLIFRGISLGWTEHEFGITLGNGLTVYGELVYNAVEKTLRFETPLAFVAEKASMVKKLKDQITETQAGIILFSIPFAISGGYLVYRFLKRNRSAPRYSERT